MPGKDVDLIKERLDLVEVLRSYIQLVPAGKNFKALCPFHGEKTPSFIVSPERKTWHCFGCGEGGDLISFVMKYEHLEFPEALRFLAEKAGVELQRLNPQAEREFGVLYDMHAVATSFYRDELKKCPRALEYLKKRTLLPATMDEFEIGYAPGGETLTMHLLKKGFAIEDVVRGGLSGKTVYGLYRDRFQQRVIFPIENQVGKVVAFTGRVLPTVHPLKPGEPEPPKYLNSSETPIFVKSKVLFGLSKAKQEIARSKTVVIMEGQLDLILAWQSGIRNAVAVSGTGLSHEHLERLRRMADTVCMSFDNDAAGVKALERGLEMLGNYDYHLKAIDLGEYKDPGEASEKDPTFLSKAVLEAKPAFERFIVRLFEGEHELAEKKRIVKSVLRLIRAQKSAVEQSAWLRELAKQAGTSEVALLTELSQLPAGAEKQEEREAAKTAVPKRIDAIAARLLSLVFTRQDFFAMVSENKELLPELYRKIIENPASAEAGFLEMQSSVLVASDAEAVTEEFRSLMRELKIEHLKAKQSAAKQMIRQAEEKNSETEALEAKQRFNDISRELNELKNSR